MITMCIPSKLIIVFIFPNSYEVISSNLYLLEDISSDVHLFFFFYIELIKVDTYDLINSFIVDISFLKSFLYNKLGIFPFYLHLVKSTLYFCYTLNQRCLLFTINSTF